MSDTWTPQDREYLAKLAECDDPQWVGEVAHRAMRYIASLEKRLAPAARPNLSYTGEALNEKMVPYLAQQRDDASMGHMFAPKNYPK